MAWLLVFLGGGLGSVCRYGLAELLPKAEVAEGALPWATLLANFFACLLLGAGLALAGRDALGKGMGLGLVVGFCGGFSTFSTFTGELLALYEGGHWLAAAGYLFLSLATGVVAILVGVSLLR